MFRFVNLLFLLTLMLNTTAEAQQAGPREWIPGVERIPIYRQTDASNESLYLGSEWANGLMFDAQGRLVARKTQTCLAVVYAMLEHGRGNAEYRVGQAGAWTDQEGAWDQFGVLREKDLPPDFNTVSTEIRDDRPIILQGYSRSLGSDHFMLGVGLTAAREIIAYDPLSGAEVLIPSDQMEAEITQSNGSVLKFEIKTLRTLNYSLATDAEAEAEELAGDLSAKADPNSAFRDAANLYSAAISLPEAQRAEALVEVRELLELIADEYPDSLPGARILSGAPLGVIEREVVFADESRSRAAIEQIVALTLGKFNSAANAFPAADIRIVAEAAGVELLAYMFNSGIDEDILWQFLSNTDNSLIPSSERAADFVSALFDDDTMSEMQRIATENTSVKMSEGVLQAVSQAVFVEFAARGFGHFYGEKMAEYFRLVGDGTLTIADAVLTGSKASVVGLTLYNSKLWLNNAREFATLGADLKRLQEAGVDFPSAITEAELWRLTYIRSLDAGRPMGPKWADEGDRELTLEEIELINRVLSDMQETKSALERAQNRLKWVDDWAISWSDFLQRAKETFSTETPLDGVGGSESFPSGIDAQEAAPDGFLPLDLDALPKLAQSNLEPGLYSIDPALCSVEGTVGDAWGGLFQRVSASSVSRGYERDCDLISVSRAGDTISVSAGCRVEGSKEDESWTWRKTSNASFEEIEGRHSGKSYARCGSANKPSAEAAAPPSAMTGKWGPSIVPDRSIQLGYRPCGDRADVRTCLEEKGLSKDAIDFSLATPLPGEIFATSFRELGAVDLVVASTPYAPYEAWFLVDGGPRIFEPEITRGLSSVFVDAASQSMLRRFPAAQNFYSPIAAHRLLADGTQRFVLIETVTNQCRACDILGSAITFLEVGPSTGGQIRRLPIGLSLDGPNNNAEISAGQLIGRPARLQAILNSLGYDAGPMDGYPGPQTRTALMEFQVEQCLPPTGQPDPTTAKALIEANGFEAPCANSYIPAGISANTPLLAGMYVDDLALCMLEEIPFETVHLRQRIIRGGWITWGQEGSCEMARTDIRDGITLFRGTCTEGSSTEQIQWRFDVLSNDSFVDLDMLTSGSPVTPMTFSRCPADSPLRQAWSSWFGQDQLVAQGQMGQSKNEAFFEPERGTELRTEILDAVRPIAEEAYGAPVQFVVGTLRVGNDIAYMGGTVQRLGGEAIDIAGTPAFQRGQIDFISGDPNLIDALLQRDGSGWKVIRHVLGPSEAWWLDDCATWRVLFPETCSAAGLPEAATETGTLPVTQRPVNSPGARNGQPMSVASSEFEVLRSLIKFDGEKLRIDAEFDNCVITTYYFSGFGTLFDHLGGGFGYDAEVAIIDAKSIDLEKSIATPSRYVERVALTSVRGSGIDYLPINQIAMAGKTTRLDRREDFVQHFKDNYLPRSRRLPLNIEWRSERQLDVLLIADDFVPDRQEINEAFFNVIRACQVEQTANTGPNATAPEPAKSALAGGAQVEAVDDAVADKLVIKFSDNSPATMNGQPMSVAVQTYRDPQALAILTKNGLINASALPNPPRLASQDSAPTGVDRNVLDRPAALAMLRSEVFGGLYVEKVGSRTMRVREQDLSAFTEALITAIFSDDPRVREAQLDGLTPIREFGRSADFDSNFVEQLRFGLDYGQRFIGLWQSGTASLPNQVWRIMDVGVPTYQPHPKLDPNGTLIAQIGVADVSGIFVTGVTAEAQFTLKPLDDVRPALAEAARLKLRPMSMIEYPSGGSRKTSGFDLTSENATKTAYFRLYDDGWRLWNVR
ncbi:MAG: peptidoglycan-binding domain-containing protein [Marinosulfonomonas sp.]